MIGLLYVISANLFSSKSSNSSSYGIGLCSDRFEDHASSNTHADIRILKLNNERI
jgi:hypothetical protein